MRLSTCIVICLTIFFTSYHCKFTCFSLIICLRRKEHVILSHFAFRILVLFLSHFYHIILFPVSVPAWRTPCSAPFDTVWQAVPLFHHPHCEYTGQPVHGVMWFVSFLPLGCYFWPFNVLDLIGSGTSGSGSYLFVIYYTKVQGCASVPYLFYTLTMQHFFLIRSCTVFTSAV